MMDRAGVGAYRPKKFKRQRRQRGVSKTKARMRYRKNRGVMRQKAKRRYRQVRKNPSFKRKKRLYKRMKQKFRRLASDPLIHSNDETLDVKDEAIEFLIELGSEWREGFLLEISADEWEVSFMLDDGSRQTMDVDDFISNAVMFDDSDFEEFYDLLDLASDLTESEEEDEGTLFILGPFDLLRQASILSIAHSYLNKGGP